jgi:hypothetical protein
MQAKVGHHDTRLCHVPRPFNNTSSVLMTPMQLTMTSAFFWIVYTYLRSPATRQSTRYVTPW